MGQAMRFQLLQVSIIKNTKVKFTVDKNTTLLFPIDDRAWSESPKVDKILVRKMKKEIS